MRWHNCLPVRVALAGGLVFSLRPALADPPGGGPPEEHAESDDPTRPVTDLDLRLLYEDNTTTKQSDKHEQILRINQMITLNEYWRIGLRFDFPLTASNAISSTDLDGGYQYGVGRPLVSAYLANILTDRWAYAFGGQVHSPALSGVEFGSQNWDVRPFVAVRTMLPEISDGSFFVPVLRYAQTFAQNASGRLTSNMQFSPQLKIDLPGTWYVALFPSPDIRWNFGAKSSGQTGRLFLPFDASAGRNFGRFLTSLEVSVPIVKDYPVYHLKIEARLSYQL
jgi:hypothetical protein